jgi:methyl-accepting chemotaxis protein
LEESVQKEIAVRKKKIYFWERIAFRICAGFILPVLMSGYALYHVSTVFTETSEFEERIKRMWHLVHMNENKAILSLTKMRLNVQSILSEPLTVYMNQLTNELKEFKYDLEQSKRILEKIAQENGVEVDSQVHRLAAQAAELNSQFVIQLDRLAEAVRKQNMNEGYVIKKDIDRLALEIENLMGKQKATNELMELKVSEELTKAREKSNRVLGFFLVTVLIFGVASAIFVTYSITSPVRQILNRVMDLAQGDGDLTKRIYTRSSGEMRELADWMNLFLKKTQFIIGTISNASMVVRQTTGQVSFHTNRTSVASSGIGKNMMEQSMNLDECTNSLASIDNLIQSSGESTRQAASLSKIAMHRALQGGASVHETIEAMEKIEESAKKIEELVSSINEIASQTNLLAINAAIEATKAGEHGKGFAVVAEEVRKLAERARKLTGEVTGLMGESSARVKAGVNLAKGAGVSLDGIIKDVEAVSSLIQRIAASASKQTESSTLVVEFMQKVSDAGRKNLTQMQDVSRATEFTAIEVGKLDSLVSQLNQIVGQFRIEAESPTNETIENMLANVQPISEENPQTRVRSGLSPLPAGAVEQEYVEEATPTVPTDLFAENRSYGEESSPTPLAQLEEVSLEKLQSDSLAENTEDPKQGGDGEAA